MKPRHVKRPIVRAWVLVLLALALPGCSLPWTDDGDDGPAPPTGATQQPPTRHVAFAGRVTHAADGLPIPHADVRLDLAQVRPCRQEGIVWAATDARADDAGRFGPIEVPVPRSDDVAFFLHVAAPGYSRDVTFIGPQEARGDTRNLTIRLHPEAAVEGTAAPGTVLALEWPGFPRLAAAGADGRFAFPNAHVTPMQLVADTSPPYHANVTAPATLDVPHGNGTGWRLEGSTRLESGAPVPAEVVAWNGTRLVSAARASETGVFVLPLEPRSMEVRIEAQTPDGRYGGAKLLDVKGPPAQREAVLLRAMC